MRRAWRTILHPVAAVMAVLLAAPVGLLVLAGLALQLQPVRDVVLRAVLYRVRAPLPGDLSIRSVRWSDLDALTLGGVLWTVRGDTLLAADHLKVELDLPPLLRRDLVLDVLEARAQVVDLPAIGAALGRDRGRAGGEGGGEEVEVPAPSFPRDGFLGLPSVSVGRLEVALARLVLPDSTLLVDLEAAGSADLLRGGPGRLELETLQGLAPERGWEVTGTTFKARLEEGTIEGSSRGRLGEGWPYRLDLMTVGEDSLLIELRRGDGPGPPGGVGLNVWAGLNRRRYRLESADLDLTVRTPDLAELRTWPGLDSLLVGLADLEGVTARFVGNLRVQGGAAADGVLALEPASWLPGGAVLGGIWEGGRLEADSLAIGLEGLAFRGRLALDDTVVAARGEARLRSWDWLRRLRPDAEPPDTLVADLLLDARWPRAPGATGLVAFGLSARDLSLAGSAAVTRNGELVAHLSPLVLRDAAAVGLPPLHGPPRTSHLVRQQSGVVRIEGLRVIGDGGEVAIDGIYAPEDRADFRVTGVWPVPPELLLAHLPLTPEQRAEIESRWPLEGPYEVTAEGSFGLQEPARLSASGTLHLPGPSTLGPLLPGGVRFDDYGAIQGRFEIDGAAAEGGFRYQGMIELDRSDWLGRALLRFRGGPDEVAADTLALALPGVEVAGRSRRTAGIWDARASVRITDAELARHFIPDLDEDATIDLAAEGTFRGTPERPDLRAEVSGALVVPRATLPQLAGTVRWSDAGLRAHLQAPSGFAAGDLVFDTLEASYRNGPGQGTEILPGTISLAAAGVDLSLSQTAEVSRFEDGHWQARFDSLAVRLVDREMSAEQPFTVALRPDAQQIEVRGLRLAGGLGTLRADGLLGPGSADLEAAVRLRLPPEPVLVTLDPRLWPEQVDVTLRAHGPDSLDVDLALAGLRIGDRARYPAAVRLGGGGGRLGLRLRVGDGDRLILAGEATAPGDLRLYPFRFELGDGPFTADFDLAEFPVPLTVSGLGSAEAIERPAHAGGRVLVRGTPAAPVALADVTVNFRDWPKMSAYELQVQGRLGAGEATSAAPERQRLRLEMLEGGEPSARAQDGLNAALVLRRGQEQVLQGSAAYPADWSLSPFAFVPSEDGQLRLALDSRPLDLDHFDPLVPPDVSLRGTAEIHFRAAGQLPDPSLEGTLRGNEVRIDLATGTRVTGDLDLALSGSRRRPVLDGNIGIRQGLIRVPEEERELLPTEGRPVLWQQGLAPPDIAEAQRASEPGQGLPGLEMDVTIDIPGSLWLRGRGLEVELAGQLELVQTGGAGRPTVAGNLRSVRGTFQLLGRSFEVRSGEVTFYGEDELDPSLDLLLTTRVSDAVIEVAFTGTLQEPAMTLSSTPEMAEGDIMSYLVFGEPVDRLSGDQVSLVQNRAAEMVTTFGATELAGVLSQQLGMDLLTVRQGQGEETTLIVGKYLGPSILLKYEQPLDQRQTFFINLEYFITRQLKLETLVGQGAEAQQGLELDWSKEY